MTINNGLIHKFLSIFWEGERDQGEFYTILSPQQEGESGQKKRKNACLIYGRP